MTDQENEMGKIESRLKSLENRIARLESALVIQDSGSLNSTEQQIQIAGPSFISETADEEEKGLESQIGRIGLAWLGNIVLLFGIIFLAQYMMIQGFRIFSAVLGFIAALSMFFLAKYLKKTNDHLSFMFKMNAQVLLF
jgi:uncharacterized membrane protein